MLLTNKDRWKDCLVNIDSPSEELLQDLESDTCKVPILNHYNFDHKTNYKNYKTFIADNSEEVTRINNQSTSHRASSHCSNCYNECLTLYIDNYFYFCVHCQFSYCVRCYVQVSNKDHVSHEFIKIKRVPDVFCDMCSNTIINDTYYYTSFTKDASNSIDVCSKCSETKNGQKYIKENKCTISFDTLKYMDCFSFGAIFEWYPISQLDYMIGMFHYVLLYNINKYSKNYQRFALLSYKYDNTNLEYTMLPCINDCDDHHFISTFEFIKSICSKINMTDVITIDLKSFILDQFKSICIA